MAGIPFNNRLEESTMLKAFAIALVMSTAQPAVVTEEGAKAPTVSESIVVVEKPMGKKRPRNRRF